MNQAILYNPNATHNYSHKNTLDRNCFYIDISLP
jgi:hypothetical protein